MVAKNAEALKADVTVVVLVGQFAYLILVAFLWGFTNPMLKQSSQGIEKIKSTSRIRQLVSEVHFLVSNWKYMVPFLINQSGSLIYYLTLASADLTIAVPITNAVTFLFTVWAGKMLGEKDVSLEAVFGMILVAAGVLLCVCGSLGVKT